MVRNLSLMINEILNNEKLKNELKTLKNKEQIYDFFVKNGYEGDYEEFCIGMKELFSLFEVSDDDLDSVVGGIGVNSSKAVATLLSVLSLANNVSSISAAYVPSNTKSSSIENVQNSQSPFDDSFLNSFFSSHNKEFFDLLKSKFVEKTSMPNFACIDKLITKLENYYKTNKNDLNAKIVSNILFSVIKMVESKNSENDAVKQNVTEAKNALKLIANKLKNDEEVSSRETLDLVEKVKHLYEVQESKKFKSVKELKDAIEDLINTESSKTYKSFANKEKEIEKLEDIISGVSEYYVNIENLNGKTFENYIRENKNYKELMKNKKSVNIKNILKMIKSACKNDDVEFENSTIKAAPGKDNSLTFIDMSTNKLYQKIEINDDSKKALVNQLKTACDYSNHVYMFEKSDKYEYDPENEEYYKFKESNQNEENSINHESKVDEDSPYFGYFGDNFAGSVDIIRKGEEQGTIYITFRGTYSKDDVWIDSDFAKIECKFLNGKCVHKGFLNRYLQLQKDMRRLIEKKVDIYRKKEKKDIKKIVITGHSLGGALSTLAALDLQQNQEVFFENSKEDKNHAKIPVKLITFCSPRVLSFEAYNYVTEENILPQKGENGAIRIYRHGDVVSSMPFGSMGYKHFGEVFCITNAPSKFESGNGKNIYSYFSIKNWTEWVKSFIGYHSITGVLEDVSNLGKKGEKDKEVKMYKELF